MKQQWNIGSRARIALIVALVAAYVIPLADAEAAPRRERPLIQLEKRTARLQARLLKRFDAATLETRSLAVAGRAGRSSDSDSDGVPDNFEDDESTCNPDSDDDGRDDGEEYEDGTDPDDDESLEESDNEVERSGLIEALSDQSVTVEGTAFSLTNETDLSVLGHAVALSFFQAGVHCVEVEGYRDESQNLIATRIWLEECRSSDDEDTDDDNDDDDESQGNDDDESDDD